MNVVACFLHFDIRNPVIFGSNLHLLQCIKRVCHSIAKKGGFESRSVENPFHTALFWQWFGKPVLYIDHSGAAMRFIQTFIVHLYVDTEVPGQLCGNMRSLEETGMVSFKTLMELEALLYQMTQKPRISPKINPPRCTGQPDDKEIQ